VYRDHTVGVVVPAYNEAGFVGTTIDTIPDYVDRVYVVDDASTDGTWSEVAEHAEAANRFVLPEAPGFDVRVVPIRHRENRGVGGAIKTGYLRARDDGIDVTAVMGGDNQMNPAELHRYLDPIVAGDADYVKGSRFLRPEDSADMPRFRLLGNVLLSYLTKVASGYWAVLDPQNGYTAISLSALRRADVEGMYEYYGYCNDLLVKLNVEDLRVADVPRSSSFAYDDGWKSHIDYAEYVPRVSTMLARNFFGRLNEKYLFRRFHPLALFYYLGVGLAGAGVVRALGARLRGLREGAGGTDQRGGGQLRTILTGAVLILYAAVLDAEDNRELQLQVRGDPARDHEPSEVAAGKPGVEPENGEKPAADEPIATDWGAGP